MSLKDNLRKQRTRANLSQEKLAGEMSVSRQTISKWENGDTYPSTGHILMLAKILDCSMDDLVDHCPSHIESDGQTADVDNTAPQIRKKHIFFVVSIAFAMATILFSFGIINYSLTVEDDPAIDHSKVAVFDKIVDGSFEEVILADGYAKKKVVGYGIDETNGSFYIKCDLEKDGHGGPCSAIIYFCENNGTYSYECQYLDDPDYLPSGEFYKVS